MRYIGTNSIEIHWYKYHWDTLVLRPLRFIGTNSIEMHWCLNANESKANYMSGSSSGGCGRRLKLKWLRVHIPALDSRLHNWLFVAFICCKSLQRQTKNFAILVPCSNGLSYEVDDPECFVWRTKNAPNMLFIYSSSIYFSFIGISSIHYGQHTLMNPMGCIIDDSWTSLNWRHSLKNIV